MAFIKSSTISVYSLLLYVRLQILVQLKFIPFFQAQFTLLADSLLDSLILKMVALYSLNASANFYQTAH
jgi:hypothetical protein